MKKLITIVILSLAVGFSYASDNKKEDKGSSKTCLIKITDNNGDEIVGAKVSIIENGKEYFSDFNGNLQVELNKNEAVTLKIESIGYTEKTFSSSQLNTFNDISLNSL